MLWRERERERERERLKCTLTVFCVGELPFFFYFCSGPCVTSFFIQRAEGDIVLA